MERKPVEIPSTIIEKLARAMCLQSGQDPDMVVCPCEPARVGRIGGVGFLVPRPEHCSALWSDFVPAAEAALLVLGEILQLQFTLVDSPAAK